MRAKQFIESALGISPKREKRAGSRPERGHEPQKRYVTDRKTGKQYDPEEEFDKLKNSPEFQAQMKRMATKEDQGISKDQETKFHAKLDNLVHDTFGKRQGEMEEGADERKQNALWAQITAHEKAAKKSKDLKQQHHLKMANDLRSQLKTSDEPVDEIAGAFPSPSTRAQWAKDAAASNAAEAKRQAELKAKADAQRLQQNTELVDKEQKVNHHSLSPDTTPPVPMKESKTQKVEPSKPRNFVAKNAINTGAGAHKDKKKAMKQGDEKHKAKAIPLDEVMAELERQFHEEKAPRALCISSKPDEDLGASQLASCKSQGLRARDGNKSHKLGKSKKSRIKVGGHKIKGDKYGGPLPDWS